MLFGTTAAVLVGYAALSAFETFFTVHSSFAAVTAPAVQVKAAEGGALALDGLVPGMHVDQGQRLGRILNPDLEADLGIETTRLDSTKALIAELESAVKAQPAGAAASAGAAGAALSAGAAGAAASPAGAAGASPAGAAGALLSVAAGGVAAGSVLAASCFAQAVSISAATSALRASLVFIDRYPEEKQEW